MLLGVRPVNTGEVFMLLSFSELIASCNKPNAPPPRPKSRGQVVPRACILGPSLHPEIHARVRSPGSAGCGPHTRQVRGLPGATLAPPRNRRAAESRAGRRWPCPSRGRAGPGPTEEAQPREEARRRGGGRGRRAASREAPRGEGPGNFRAGGLVTWRQGLPRYQEAAGPTGRRVSFLASAAAAADPEVRAGC